MKSILLFILLIPTVLHAQDVNFKWAKQMVGGGPVELGRAVAVDKQGNVYTTGHFSHTVDFDPGPGIYNLTRPYIGYSDFGYDDMFVSKLDAAGNFVWAKQIAAHEDYEGTEAVSIALDTAGNIYTTGYFYGTVDFDPGPCIYNLTAVDGEEVFVLKLSPEGDFIWGKRMSSASNSYSYANFISLDLSGNVYTTGHFSHTVDFDPGSGVYNLTAAGYYDMFVSKLNSDGNFIWAKQMKGDSAAYSSNGVSIAFDGSGNLFTTGDFRGTVDFDPGNGVYNLSSVRSYSMFISKLDIAGNFIWAKQMTGNDTSSSWGTNINIDNFENIITTGGFYGTVDFDPGSGVYNLTSTFSGGDNMFVSKLNPDGNFIWEKQIGGTGNSNNTNGGVYCISAALDTLGNIYSTGYFLQTVDFDPGTGVFNFYTGADSSNFLWPAIDMFISKLNADGNFTWAKQIHTTGGSYTRQALGSSIKLDNYGNIYISGGFKGTADFDPGTGTYNLTSPYGDIFVYKMSSCISSTSSALTVTDCKSYSLNGHTYTASGVYTQTILNASGCDSIITLNLTINRVDTTINISACNSYTHCHTYNNCTICYTYDTSGIYTDTLTATNGCDSLVHLNLTIKHNIVTNFNAVACGSYIWNGQIYTGSGIYIDTLTNADGCDSIIKLNLTISTIGVSTHPQSISVCKGSDAAFSIVASGVLAYHWQLSTDGGNTFNDIANATDSTYTLTSVTSAQDGNQFRCIVTGECDTIISSVAVLSVISPASILAQPAGTEICSGSNASFLVSANGTQTFSYRWQLSTDGGTSYSSVVNGGKYSGATSSLLTITGADAALNNNRYRCVLSNAVCSTATTSNAAVLTVRKLPVVSLTATPHTSLYPWQSTTLTATPIGSGGVLSSTTWVYNNTVVPNPGNTRTVNFDQIGSYQVRAQERWPSDLVCSNQWETIIIDAQAGKRLFIYPNPNTGQFNISYYNSSGIGDLRTVTVYDSKGARVYNATFTVTGIYTTLNIKLVPASASVYAVVIADTKGERFAVGNIVVIH